VFVQVGTDGVALHEPNEMTRFHVATGLGFNDAALAAKLDGMLAYAASKGWIRDGHVQAHVERGQCGSSEDGGTICTGRGPAAWRRRGHLPGGRSGGLRPLGRPAGDLQPVHLPAWLPGRVLMTDDAVEPLGEDLAQVVLADDQQPVEKLAAQDAGDPRSWHWLRAPAAGWRES
jgi:hypothetical protein